MLSAKEANYDCSVLCRDFKGIKTNDCEKNTQVVGAEQLGTSPRQCTSAFSTCDTEFLATNSTTALEYPPQSPDWVRYGFFVFPKIKEELLKGAYFINETVMKNTCIGVMSKLNKNYFQHGYQLWNQKWKTFLIFNCHTS